MNYNNLNKRLVSRARGGKNTHRSIAWLIYSGSYPVFVYVAYFLKSLRLYIGSFQLVGRGVQSHRRTTPCSIGRLDYRPYDRPSVCEYGPIYKLSGSVGLSRIPRT